MTSANDRALLLRVARAAIEAHVKTGKEEGAERLRSAAREAVSLADRRAGVFVTIHLRGELRGCIGYVEADAPLPDSVARYAVAACSDDPRFPAVSPLELPQTQIELSLLGPMEPVSGAGDVEIGRHGLMIEMGRDRGLLLPQVAAERYWDAATFLAQTCRKAGLAADSWRHGATVWRFEAEVFGENGA